jgi:hypothetical protein
VQEVTLGIDTGHGNIGFVKQTALFSGSFNRCEQ